MDKEEGDGSSGRARRQKRDRHGRGAALEKLKQLKGTKHKYEITDEAPVYDLVDEKSYSKMVQDRQDDDWIVDDGTGYVEDGREIFDDDETDGTATKGKSDATKKSYKAPVTSKPKGRDLKSMFNAMPIKKKSEGAIKLDDDLLLGGILEGINSGESSKYISPKPNLLKKRDPSQTTPQRVKPNKPSNPFAKISSPIVPDPQPIAKTSNKKQIGITPKFQKRKSDETEKSSSRKKGRNECYDENILIEDSDSQVIDSKMDINSSPEPSTSSKSTGSRAAQCVTKFKDGEEEDGVSIEACESQPEEYTGLKDSKAKIEDIGEMDNMFGDSVDESMLRDIKMSPVKSRELNATGKNFILEETKQTTSKNFVDQWDDMLITANEVQVDVQVDSSTLPLETTKNDEKVLRIFWLDAFEDFFKHPGVVYLFGKIWIESAESYVSCCVIVKEIERRVFLLPREKISGTDKDVTMKDVFCEFEEQVSKKYGITEFKSKATEKNYAFDNAEVPNKCEYLEVRYSAKFRALSADLKGSTFSHTFGTNTSSLEQLLVEIKIKGPCWLEIKEPKISSPPVSWCKVEAVIDRANKISVMAEQRAKPDIVALSLSVQTVLNPLNHNNEIVAIGACVHRNYPLTKSAPTLHENYFCALSKPSNAIFPYDFKKKAEKFKELNIEKVDSERALLTYFLARLQKIDPDILLGHDIVGFYLEILLARLGSNNIANWSRVGRLRRNILPKGLGYRNIIDKTLTSGRLLCDIKISAQELIRCRSYGFPELVTEVLQKPHQSIKSEDIRGMYSSSGEIIVFARQTLLESSLVLKIANELNILPLALQITNIAGNLLGRTLLGGRAERNEFLLLHAFNEKNYICPDKYSGKSKRLYLRHEEEDGELEASRVKGGRKKKAAYSGGLVLEPKKGFYNNFILLMDFNSLYPSIIQEYNICFTTVKRYNIEAGEEEPVACLPEGGQEMGILPTEIFKLVESRRNVKKLMATPNLPSDLKAQYDIRQKALKLTANSMYGCLGFSNSRFYAKPLAALITERGRDILMSTKLLVEKMGLEVIYGDTDSIMINSNSKNLDDIMELGKKIKKEVNKMYKELEIEVDGVFKSMLLLKKKKYAAITANLLPDGKLLFNKELKGLDIVRRDWSDLARKAGEFVIDKILSDKDEDDIAEAIYDHLEKLGMDINAGKIPLADYVITKQLTKNPEDYPDKKSLAHVQVAIRMNQKRSKRLRQGDTVPYIICEDGTNVSPIQRAYHVDEVQNPEADLIIDTKYYIQQQLLPVISRLCEPIEFITIPGLVGKLCLDPNAFNSSGKSSSATPYIDTADEDARALLDSETRFENCAPLIINCPNKRCEKEVIVTKTFLEVTPHNLKLSFTDCPHCGYTLLDALRSHLNFLHLQIRSFIQKYYEGVLVCEENCGYNTRRVSLRLVGGKPICGICQKPSLKKEYDETRLYHQILYFRYIMDLDKAFIRLKRDHTGSDYPHDAIQKLRYDRVSYFCGYFVEELDKYIKWSKYSKVDLGQLFENLNTLSLVKPND